jgi:hypothetical protein
MADTQAALEGLQLYSSAKIWQEQVELVAQEWTGQP